MKNCWANKMLKMTITGILPAVFGIFLPACSATRSFLAIDNTEHESKPIQNPFGDVYGASNGAAPQTVVLRTKKGDRAVEVELPADHSAMSDLVVPLNPAFGNRSPAEFAETGDGEDPSVLQKRPPTYTDREITARFPQGSPENIAARREVENELGVIPSEFDRPEAQTSYLAGVDHIKKLFRNARYEAAALEIENMLREYQTDPKLHEMRGTVLERLGHTELAIQSWNQSLRLNPTNESLRKFIDRKKLSRGLASP